MKNGITYKKLIILFSGIVVPLFLLSLILIQQNNTYMKKRTLSVIQEKTYIIADKLINTLNDIYNSAFELTTQANIKNLAHIDFPISNYEKAKSSMQIREQQSSITNANPYIDNLVIYYRVRGEAYNSIGKGPSIFYFSEEEYQEIIDSQAFSDHLILYQQKPTEIIYSPLTPDFLIRVDLSSQAITSLLEEHLLEYEPYYLLDAFDHEYQLTNLSAEQLSQLPIDDLTDQVIIHGEHYHHFASERFHGKSQIHFFISNEMLFANMQIYQYLNLFLGILMLFSCLFFLFGSYIIIHKPIKTLISAFQNINNQNYNIRILNNKNSDFSFLYSEFNHMAEELEILIDKNYKQQLLINRAELKQLQAQINPHFLYNSLFLVRRMIQDELYDEAYHVSDTLGLYFQYVTRNAQDYMPLSKEYQHALLYCEIQQLRFEGRISIKADDLPNEYSKLMVPKLIIQPILENAFKYGFQDKENNGLLRVTISSNAAALTITIEDNGENLTNDQLETLQTNLQLAVTGNSLREMTGILNIQRRLNLHFANLGFLKASRSPLGGLCVQLIIPINSTHEKELESHDKNIIS